jgi:hypothetical protein
VILKILRPPFEAALQEAVYKLARVRLSTGAIIKSKRNEGVPSEGTVAGGRVSSARSLP